ncbi:MAG TPA: GIY-YIG nuclease family protein [Lacipirellulaceae bacterium]|jgi:hypothetical protein|nr:GIY-YIG nuclease family protein [Lacipirellulaceae bacterium]
MDRKSQIRKYKETPRPMGIFQIQNTASGKVFIGSSKDLPAILNRHQFQLKLGGHPNTDLQRDWNEQGTDAFAFSVLDTLAPSEEPNYDPTDDLAALEQLWMAKLIESQGGLYNSIKASLANAVKR